MELLPSMRLLPYPMFKLFLILQDMETDQERALWANSGNWDWTYTSRENSVSQVSWLYDAADAVAGYDTGATNYGDLTSPPFAIPSSGYFLRFLYKYQTEGDGIHWDRRVVQISENGGDFKNIYQFSEDPSDIWLQSSFYRPFRIRRQYHPSPLPL